MTKAINYTELKKQFKLDRGVVLRGYICGQELMVAVIQDGNYYKVATALCSRKDTFVPKKGKRKAITRLYAKQFILVPCGYTGFKYGTIDMPTIELAMEELK